MLLPRQESNSLFNLVSHQHFLHPILFTTDVSFITNRLMIKKHQHFTVKMIYPRIISKQTQGRRKAYTAHEATCSSGWELELVDHKKILLFYLAAQSTLKLQYKVWRLCDPNTIKYIYKFDKQSSILIYYSTGTYLGNEYR